MVDLTPETMADLWRIISLFVGACSANAFARAFGGWK